MEKVLAFLVESGAFYLFIWVYFCSFDRAP